MDYASGEWTVDTHEGQFAPSAFGPKNTSVEVTEQHIDIEHDAPSDYWPLVSVRVPRAWLMAAIAAFDAHRAKAGL